MGGLVYDHPRLVLPIPLSQDPILFDLDVYGRARNKNRAIMEAYYEEVITRVSQFDGAPRRVCRFLTELIEAASSTHNDLCRVDPFYSTIIRSWIDGLKRGLDAVDIGADPSFLDFFSDLPALQRDLSIEYMDLITQHPVPNSTTIGESMRIVPVATIAESPRLAVRVRDCLPNFPDLERYRPVGETEIHVISHIRRALDLLREIDPDAYLGFTSNVHTIFVAVLRSRKTSMGSRDNLPGSIIAGFSENRLIDDDIAFTASQLYHEHCHLKLSLFLRANGIRLPKAETLISPFKNENRNIECILQTLYTIAIELQIRMGMLPAYEAKARARAIAYLAAVCYRLELTQAIFEAHPQSSLREEFIRINGVAKSVIADVLAEVDKVSPAYRKAHALECERAIERHAWDIGQFLCRGIDVDDPGLELVAKRDSEVEYVFRGKAWIARIEPARVSPGDYGATLEPFCKDKA